MGHLRRSIGSRNTRSIKTSVGGIIMNRERNKSICRERLLKLQENDINKLIISEIADLAYCNGYNTVLDAAEKVLSNEDYFKIVKQLKKEE